MARIDEKLQLTDDATTEDEILDAIGTDAETVEEMEKRAGPVGRALISAVDKAVHIQGSTIKRYVDRLRRKNPDASPADLQKIMDKHFLTTVSGTGAGVGAAAAIPGIGLFTGAAAVAGESVVFLDFAAVYTVASAYLRGVDISDPERRRALVLIVLLGTKGTAIVEALMGDAAKGAPVVSNLSRFSAPKLTTVNNRLMRFALKRVTRRFATAWIGKLLPLGLGAVAGTMVNRKLANEVINNVSKDLGPTPTNFLTEIEPAVREEDLEAEEEKELERLTGQSKKQGKVKSVLSNAKDTVGNAIDGVVDRFKRK
ncbi:hypothetical protein [Corynebacterium pilosum]|uniref:Hypothetical membrane protein n=1 Tax=Corynebacterium pilosum TaxID=35756 RepID=A0A376CPG6_9CORY|nr:hypothetical protein [Corynebacterium pilosum]STC70172.1 hypothetical membrane protein [Corynebacterium pilosum]